MKEKLQTFSHWLNETPAGNRFASWFLWVAVFVTFCVLGLRELNAQTAYGHSNSGVCIYDRQGLPRSESIQGAPACACALRGGISGWPDNTNPNGARSRRLTALTRSVFGDSEPSPPDLKFHDRLTDAGLRTALCYHQSYARVLHPSLSAAFDTTRANARINRAIRAFDREIGRLWKGQTLAA